MVKIAFVSRDSCIAGRPVFEVPLIDNAEGHIIPRCPVGGAAFFYNHDISRCAAAATKTAAAYLRQRNYAKFIGLVAYSADGIDHFGWRPQD